MVTKNVIKRWKNYSKISGVGAITRRYFVMNAFDGALTMLGVVIGAYISGVINQPFQKLKYWQMSRNTSMLRSG